MSCIVFPRDGSESSLVCKHTLRCGCQSQTGSLKTCMDLIRVASLSTGVYNTSRKALGPAPASASAAPLARLAAAVSSWLLDAFVPAIMTAAHTRPSTPPGDAWQPLVGSGSVMLEKTRTSLGYASGKLLMKSR